MNLIVILIITAVVMAWVVFKKAGLISVQTALAHIISDGLAHNNLGKSDKFVPDHMPASRITLPYGIETEFTEQAIVICSAGCFQCGRQIIYSDSNTSANTPHNAYIS